jgi:protein involved in polysaccharide export with SLBB domain
VILAVDAMSHTRGRIYVTGAVRAPGPQEIPSDEVFTLSKAIDRAGGLTDYAKGRKVRITRKDEASGKDKQMFIDVEKIIQHGNREGDLELQPDDLIFVDESGIRF